MSNPFETVAKKVIARLAEENPGHNEVDHETIQPEFQEAFPDADGILREQMMSKTLETIEQLVPEKHCDAFLYASGRSRLTKCVFPVIWPHTADQV